MKNKKTLFIISLLPITLCLISCNQYKPVLTSTSYKHYIDSFNALDNELYQMGIYPNEKAWNFLSENIPLFDCPDKQLEETYYFRWWTYRKHIRKTTEGYIITEFLPDVPWAGTYNAISCPVGHHFYEGRWLKDPKYLTDYARFWLIGSGKKAVRSYSNWIANAIFNHTQIHENNELLRELLPALEENFNKWENERRDSTHLFWQIDDRDGMEISVSGSYGKPYGQGYRATINSYMYGDALAIADISKKLGDKEKAAFFQTKADEIKQLINNKLWDKEAEFYKVIPMNYDGQFSDARELHAYTPWYFNIPENHQNVAWKYLMDPDHFYAQYGPTTVEQCHPLFSVAYTGHECQWNGASWPFATSITLTALANYLNNSEQNIISDEDFFILLTNYARSHRITFENGKSQPWIDENLNPFTGDWISRTRLKQWNNGTWDKDKGGEERGKDYNHSTFVDLIICGLAGIRPSDSNDITINPLIPQEKWDYFCLEGVPYKGHNITVYYDRTGNHYKRGKGYFVYVDGKQKFNSLEYKKITINL